ncbi:MAG: hypothetical protein OXI16_11440 [Chloroflexota bacterium]|nr:hypothetical protein [Chloroflexota bacterium]
MLIDTDILIDIALDRQPHSSPASDLLDFVERGVEPACIAWHSVSNFYYIVTSSRNQASAEILFWNSRGLLMWR